MKYAGIGSRSTPNAVIAQMKMIGAMFGARGYILRSGCAKPPFSKRAPDTDSADLAFEAGARSRHARNSIIMLGDDLNDPVSFVACWTDGGGIKGGTGQALRIAAAHGIPVYNLWHPDAFGALMAL